MNTFTSYGNVAPKLLFDFGVGLTNLDGIAAAAGYFQLFDTKLALTSGVTVPLQSYRVAAAGPLVSIFQSIGPIPFANGLTVAMSSTDEVYTAVATEYSVFGEVEDYPDNTVGATTVGDRTTSVGSLTVWANTAATYGLNSLRRVRAENGTGDHAYILLFAHSPSAGDIPIVSLRVPTEQVVTFSFGDSGIFPFTRTAAGVLRDGCYLVGSSTANVLTATTADWTIEAKYVP